MLSNKQIPYFLIFDIKKYIKINILHKGWNKLYINDIMFLELLIINKGGFNYDETF